MRLDGRLGVKRSEEVLLFFFFPAWEASIFTMPENVDAGITGNGDTTEADGSGADVGSAGDAEEAAAEDVGTAAAAEDVGTAAVAEEVESTTKATGTTAD